MVQYSINRALGELKLLEKRINKAMENGIFIDYKKDSADKTRLSNLKPEELEKIAIESLQSINDLIARKKEIKDKIVESNAKTYVTVNNVKMTVAAAIERKSSIMYDKMLLSVMKKQYEDALVLVNSENNTMERKLDLQLNQMAGSEADKKSDAMLTFAQGYRNQNQWSLVDPLNLKAKIDELEKSIDGFEAEVDYVLSTSNAITTIDINE